MTTAAAGLRPRSRLTRPGLTAALLAVSVALNLCFVAGATWTRLKPPTATTTSARFQLLGQSLNLTTPQQAIFDQYVTGLIARNNHVRVATEPLMDQAWAEIARPNPDQTRVLELLDDFSAQRHATWHETIRATMSLLAALTPEQKAKFLANEQERRNLARRRRADDSR